MTHDRALPFLAAANRDRLHVLATWFNPGASSRFRTAPAIRPHCYVAVKVTGRSGPKSAAALKA